MRIFRSLGLALSVMAWPGLVSCQDDQGGASSSDAGSQSQSALSDQPSPGTASSPRTNPIAAASAPSLHLDHAQPRLPTIQLWIGTNAVTAEVALTRVQIATGMMFRETMRENEGMLFVFGTPHQTAFYMKNTRIPLTAAYIDSEGVILELHDLEPFNEDSVAAESDRIQYVLEMNQGWFERHGVKPGTLIATERGSLRQVFFGNR